MICPVYSLRGKEKLPHYKRMQILEVAQFSCRSGKVLYGLYYGAAEEWGGRGVNDPLVKWFRTAKGKTLSALKIR